MRSKEGAGKEGMEKEEEKEEKEGGEGGEEEKGKHEGSPCTLQRDQGGDRGGEPGNKACAAARR